VLFTLFKEKKEGHRIQLDGGDHWFQNWLKDGRPGAGHDPSPDDPAIMLMSGGTTGTPKVVVGLHRCFVAAGLQLATWLQPPKGAPQDIALVPLPLFHVYACVGVQSHSLISRTPMALVPNPRDIADLLKTISAVRPTLFSAVPALFIALLNHQKVKSKSVDFSSIRACFSGAAPLMAATKTQFEALTGGRIVEGYSLTEAMMACVVNPLNGINKVGSVGVPLPDVEVAIVDAESGTKFLPNGQTGEIIVRAPQLMAGYFHNAEETARALRAHSETGPAAWLHTGDLGYVDEDSFLFIVDRQKDLIKTSGYQVWPREVEEVLAGHPSVQEVGVAGVPDNVKGEVVKAWVVRRQGTDPSVDELRAYCKQKLAPYKTPAHVEFRETLPKTMAGKVLRRALVAEHKASDGPKS
jgi:long-chain acyl-CoA synthetase